jgi:hypothetical protein
MKGREAESSPHGSSSRSQQESHFLSEYKMAGWRGYLGLVGFEVPIDLLLSPSGGVYRLWNMILC